VSGLAQGLTPLAFFGHETGEEKSHFQGLLGVETRIHRVSRLAQVILSHPAGAPNALGYVVPGQFKVDAAQEGPIFGEDGERLLQFGQNLSNRLVLNARRVTSVFLCIGSEHQRTV